MADTESAPPQQMLAADVLKHPEYQNSTWNLEPDSKGFAEVAKGRGGPFKISWEIHGTGDRLLVWVMGLGGFKTAWQRQTWHFGHTSPNKTKYSNLIIDNRGMGESDKPAWPRYSTSELAKDVFDVLESIGGKWTDKKRNLHIIGISMGGMIAQEMAYMQPERIASLSLVVTAARLVNTVGYVENLRQRINLFIPRHIDVQLANIKHRLFNPASINIPDPDYAITQHPDFPPPPEGHTPHTPFPTLGDRVSAGELAKRSNKVQFTRTGFLMQAVAAGWHHKTPAQITEIAEKVGRNRIMVMTGGMDNMISPPHGFVLRDDLNRGVNEENGEEVVRWVYLEDKGHAPPIEARDFFNKCVEEMVEKGVGLGE